MWEIDERREKPPDAELLDYYKNYLPGFDYNRHFPPLLTINKVNRSFEQRTVRNLRSWGANRD